LTFAEGGVRLNLSKDRGWKTGGEATSEIHRKKELCGNWHGRREKNPKRPGHEFAHEEGEDEDQETKKG